MEWKPIADFEGMYEVSEIGEVRSLPRQTIYVDGRVGNHKGRLIALQTNHKGYLHTSLSKDCKKYRRLVHRLVADAFVQNPENKPQVNHIDGDKLNNHYSNLEWVSNDENEIHANENGLRAEQHTPKKVAQYLNGKLIAEYRSLYQASKATGIKDSRIGDVAHGRRNSAKGYTFTFI